MRHCIKSVPCVHILNNLTVNNFIAYYILLVVLSAPTNVRITALGYHHVEDTGSSSASSGDDTL